MLSANRKESFYLLRELTYYLIKIYGEDEEVYIFCDSTYKDILYISTDLAIKKYFKDNIIAYKSVLKTLFLYTLKEEYNQVPLNSLVLIANRILRNYTYEELAKILNITKRQYQRLETGHINFENEYSPSNIAKLLNINPNEFNPNYLTLTSIAAEVSC